MNFNTILNRIRGKQEQEAQATPIPSQTEVMRRNVIDQMPYTPQAEQIARNVPIQPMSPVASYPYGGLYNGNGIEAPLNPHVLAHENIHAMDRNINMQASSDATQNMGGAFNSYGFGELLRKASPYDYDGISQILRENYDLYDVDGNTFDTEMAAQYGSRPNDLMPEVFMPYTKNINYTPRYSL